MTPVDERRAHIEVAGDRTTGLATVRTFVARCARMAGLGDEAVDDLRIVVTEVVDASPDRAAFAATVTWSVDALTVTVPVTRGTWDSQPDDRLALVESLLGTPLHFDADGASFRFEAASGSAQA